MKTFRTLSAALLILSFVNVVLICGETQQTANKKVVTSSLSGPRFGLTFFTDNVKQMKYALGIEKPYLSQFGWHTEWNVTPKSGGTSLVVEYVPLVSGCEQSKFIPSMSLLMGLRIKSNSFLNDFEFGMGPNLLLYEIQDKLFHTSLVFAIGKSFDLDGIRIPVNVAWVTSQASSRLSFLIGYAL